MKKFLKIVLCMTLILSMLITVPMTASASSSKKVTIVKVNTDYARLRSSYGNASIIKTLRSGTKLYYTGTTKHSYAKVMTENGTTGWVYVNYLSSYGTVLKSQVYKTTKKTKVYSKASSSSHGSSCPAGFYVVVTGSKGDYYHVKNFAGKSGYIKKSVLKKMS